VTFHIANMGEGTFTDAVAKAAKAGSLTTVRVDGPYGRLSLQPRNYDTVNLVCGGVGATPMVSILGAMAGAKKRGNWKGTINFYWASRSDDALNGWFPDVWKEVNEVEGINLFLYNTKKHKSDSKDQKAVADVEMSPDDPLKAVIYPTIGGRPDFSSLWAQGQEGKSCVCVCGPIPLVAGASAAAAEHGFDLHKETFFF